MVHGLRQLKLHHLFFFPSLSLTLHFEVFKTSCQISGQDVSIGEPDRMKAVEYCLAYKPVKPGNGLHQGNYEHPWDGVSPEALCGTLRAITPILGHVLLPAVGPSQMCIRRYNEVFFGFILVV